MKLLLDGVEDCPAVLKRDGAAAPEDDGVDEFVFPKLNAMVATECDSADRGSW